jgi:hypothetical protein
MTLTDSDVRAKLIMAFSTYRRGEREPISFRGRGPKDYRRPERIREDVCELLTDDPRIDASHKLSHHRKVRSPTGLLITPI